jgi:hypothetical protein
LGLVLRRCGDVLLAGEPPEEGVDVLGAELGGVAHAVIGEVALHPGEVGLLRPGAVVPHAQGVADLV